MTNEPGQSDPQQPGQPQTNERPFDAPGSTAHGSDQQSVPPSNPYAHPQQPDASSPQYGQQYGQPDASSPQYAQQDGQKQYDQQDGQNQYGQNQYDQQQPWAYGAPYAQPPYSTAPQPKVLSLTSMILGIASFVFFGFLILPQIAAIITGHLGLKKEQPQGKGFAIAGLVLGYLTLLGYGIFWILIIILGVNAASHPANYYNP